MSVTFFTQDKVGATKFSQLTDVTTSNLENYDIAKYNSKSLKWEPNKDVFDFFASNIVKTMTYKWNETDGSAPISGYFKSNKSVKDITELWFYNLDFSDIGRTTELDAVTKIYLRNPRNNAYGLYSIDSITKSGSTYKFDVTCNSAAGEDFASAPHDLVEFHFNILNASDNGNNTDTLTWTYNGNITQGIPENIPTKTFMASYSNVFLFLFTNEAIEGDKTTLLHGMLSPSTIIVWDGTKTKKNIYPIVTQQTGISGVPWTALVYDPSKQIEEFALSTLSGIHSFQFDYAVSVLPIHTHTKADITDFTHVHSAGEITDLNPQWYYIEQYTSPAIPTFAFVGRGEFFIDTTNKRLFFTNEDYYLSTNHSTTTNEFNRLSKGSKIIIHKPEDYRIQNVYVLIAKTRSGTSQTLGYTEFSYEITKSMLPYTLSASPDFKLHSIEFDFLPLSPSDDTGFDYPENVVVSYDFQTRTVTLTGSNWNAYWKGQQITSLITGWTSAAHANTAGNMYFLYYNGTNFVWSTTPWTFDMLQICFVFYYFGATFALRECHGLTMDYATHQHLHNTVGTVLLSGGDFANYVDNSSVATNRRPTISTAVVLDEDLKSTLTALNTNSYTWFQYSGTLATIQIDRPEIVYDISGIMQYNSYNVGTGQWSDTPFSNNSYGKIYVVALPTTADATSEPVKFLFIAPQKTGTLTLTQSLTFGTLTFPLVSEYVPIAEIIVHQLANDWQIYSITKLTGTKAQLTSTSAGLTRVTADIITINGDGTTSAPLSVASRVFPYYYPIYSYDGDYTSPTINIQSEGLFAVDRTNFKIIFTLIDFMGVGHSTELEKLDYSSIITVYSPDKTKKNTYVITQQTILNNVTPPTYIEFKYDVFGSHREFDEMLFDSGGVEFLFVPLQDLSDFRDTLISNPVESDVLTFASNKWINKSPVHQHYQKYLSTTLTGLLSTATPYYFIDNKFVEKYATSELTAGSGNAIFKYTGPVNKKFLIKWEMSALKSSGNTYVSLELTTPSHVELIRQWFWATAYDSVQISTIAELTPNYEVVLKFVMASGTIDIYDARLIVIEI